MVILATKIVISVNFRAAGSIAISSSLPIFQADWPFFGGANTKKSPKIGRGMIFGLFPPQKRF